MENGNDSSSPAEVTLTPIGDTLPESSTAASYGSVFNAGRTGDPLLREEPTPRDQKAIPSLANTFLFFGLAIAVTLILGMLTFSLARMLPSFRHQDLRSLALDARLTIPSQALEYLALLGATALIFRSIWQRPFWQAIEWNRSAVVRRWIPLLAIGLVLGLLNGLASNYLPMPKEAPILNDLMRSTSGAWLMFAFGTTLAPLVEELAFRGFLLPSLINFFRWLGRPKQGSAELAPASSSLPYPHSDRQASRSGASSSAVQGASMWTVPASILLASIPFALMHSEQVSGAWAPVLLIGVVSIALCVVRLWTRSLAASAFVHATYNFVLFAGMMVASDGFRHLDKLNN